VTTEPATLCPDMPVIDDSRLVSEFGDNPEILTELRDLFLEHIPPLYRAIAESMAAHEIEKMCTDVHSLKGACATYGAPRLAHICKAIETAAKAGDWDLIAAYQEMFETEFQAVIGALGGI